MREFDPRSRILLIFYNADIILRQRPKVLFPATAFFAIACGPISVAANCAPRPMRIGFWDNTPARRSSFCRARLPRPHTGLFYLIALAELTCLCALRFVSVRHAPSFPVIGIADYRVVRGMAPVICLWAVACACALRIQCRRPWRAAMRGRQHHAALLGECTSVAETPSWVGVGV